MKKRNKVIAAGLALLLAGGITAGAMGFGGMRPMNKDAGKAMHGMPFAGVKCENMQMPERFKKPEMPEMPEMPEITEEKKAEMLEKAKEQLASMLEEGKITQEQYDEQLAKLESGEMTFPFFGNRGNGKGFGNFDKDFTKKEFKAPEMPEITEEKKAEMLKKAKEQLSKMLEEGKITQEQYDEQLAKLESGEMTFPCFGNFHGKNMQGMKNRPEKAEKPAKADADTEATEEADEAVKTEKGKKMPAGGRGANKGNGFGAMGMGAKRR